MEIITAKTIARRDGVMTVTDWLRKAAARKGAMVPDMVGGAPVIARIDHGRWIADCECKGAEYVDPDEPVFLCLSCLNQGNGGHMRPVKFPSPKDRAKIEKNLSPENYHSWNETEDPIHGV